MYSYYHAWYSPDFDTLHGHNDYIDITGKTVKVTYVCRSEEITRPLFERYPWRDAVYVGIVTERMTAEV